MEERFTEFGMWRMPERVDTLESTPENSAALSLGAAFCPKGHGLVSGEETSRGSQASSSHLPAPTARQAGSSFQHAWATSQKSLRVSLSGANGSLSPARSVAPLPILAQCDRCHTGDMCVLYCSPALSIDDSVAFCNVVGCPNAMLVRSDRIIRALERDIL